MQRLRSWENYGKTFRKTSYTLAFSWSRKTIDKYHVFMTLTVSNSVGKHVENEAFAHTGKLQKNFQKNRLFIGIFLVQGNTWWTSCFSWVLPRVNGKFAIRFQISENISMMSNFSVFHHFGKLTMNKGFCAVYFTSSLLSKYDAVVILSSTLGQKEKEKWRVLCLSSHLYRYFVFYQG